MMDRRKNTILIVEDEVGARDSLWMILKPFNKLYSADNGEAALALLEETEIDLVTLDLKMPGMQGVDLLREIKKRKPNVEVIIITGYGTLKSAMDGIRYGASDYILKPFNVSDLLSSINRVLEKKHRLDALRDFLSNLAVLEGKTETKKKDYLQFAKVLSNTLENRDHFTYHHSSRVNAYAGLIADRIDITPEEREDMELGAYLHDIGKLGVTEDIIQKQSKLSDSEMEAAKKHTEIGASLVSPLELPPGVLSVIRHHHERYDGQGYPDGLSGEQIPLATRIISLAESFDAMVADRPYRKALPLNQVVEELRKCAGSQWDPALVKVLMNIVVEKGENILPAVLNPSSGTVQVQAL
jgi:putative two-component system response regulator